MNRFGPRIDAIREAAQDVCPEDGFVVLSDNLSHLGNGTFAVSIKVEREEPLAESEWEPGVDIFNRTIASVLVKPFDELSSIGTRLRTQLDVPPTRWEI